ncbi:Probable 4-amino-4-deoxy-L-arabinose-phosphoundecaprenol flippase subunit ArnE [Chlamydiales bacterium SCGC AG-110-P3]|nr:Probable 4-amino-4-deoxy-L-arabinose-phosphoundecaprenol flippase subunit ArnE [Chlamydiales bacterium SCGC AG-110-P3]
MINIIIVLSVFFSSMAQISLKLGMIHYASSTSMYSTLAQHITSGLLFNPYIAGGVSLHMAALATWLYVLKQVEVSYAYPFISLGFVLVLIVGYYLFDETINYAKCLGIASIIAGVILVSKS